MNEDAILNRIKELCENRGFSTYRLAQEADMPYSTLDNLFHRMNVPTLPTLIKICNGLQITLSDFFAGSIAKTPTPTYSDKHKKLIERYSKLPVSKKKLLDEFLTLLEKQSR
jgi:transcriptional regulator with XRE-family HTH domain